MTSPANGRVAYILKMFPRFSETFILSEILELERGGMDLQIYSLKQPNDGRFHADVKHVKAPVEYVPLVAWSSIKAYAQPHLEVFGWNPGRYLKTAFRVAKKRRWGAVKRFLQAGFIAPRLKRDGVTHVHGHFASSATSVAHYLHQLMDMGYSFTAHAKDIYIETVSEDVLIKKMKHARFVVTVSDYNNAHLARLAPNAMITRIYNGLDLDRFTHSGQHEMQTPPLLLAVGRLVEKKGFDDLIRACAVLRDRGVDYRCEIIGTGNEESKLRDLITEFDLEESVYLVGPLPREELIERYPKASLFVAPCVIGEDGNRDGLPTVLIEAMALGVPVISTPVTGIPELVKDGETGQLVPESSPTALADAIERGLNDPEWTGQMATTGRALVEEQFDLRQNVAQLRACFEKASR